MPIPEEKFRLCVDLYLCNHAALKGEIVAVKKPVGYYRIHGNNNFSGFRLESRRLKNQALNIIATVDLLQDLFRNKKNFNFPYTRWNFETLLLAKRFSDYKPLDSFSYDDLYEKWKATPQIAEVGKLRQTALKLYWYLLRFLPKGPLEMMLAEKNRRSF
jgi:hypothetical protein